MVKTRILKAEIRNIKNVKQGNINIENYQDSIKGTFGNVIGIYGQNGSGKTAFIDACSILKSLMSGNKLNEEYSKYINNENKTMVLDYSFYVSIDTDFIVNYTAEISNSNDGIIIAREKLSYKEINEDEIKRSNILIEFIADEHKPIFKPETNLNILKKHIDNSQFDLEVARRYCIRDKRSFIFSKEVIDVFNSLPTNIPLYSSGEILSALKKYSIYELLIVDKNDIGFINIGYFLPLNIKYSEELDEKETIGTLPIMTNKPSSLSIEVFDIACKVFKQLNIVLQEIIPNLNIKLNKVGEFFDKDGEKRVTVQLLSIRKDSQIDFGSESEGIKKIVSILSYIIAMYNSPSVCLLVDEFDSGVFEYLMGELLEIIADRCEGQFIFTSHNLRPLEKLNKESIVFTTINAEKRYTKMTGVKPNNNLRDYYYRTIRVGGQEEDLYDETKNYKIKTALRLASKELQTI